MGFWWVLRFGCFLWGKSGCHRKLLSFFFDCVNPTTHPIKCFFFFFFSYSPAFCFVVFFCFVSFSPRHNKSPRKKELTCGTGDQKRVNENATNGPLIMIRQTPSSKTSWNSKRKKMTHLLWNKTHNIWDQIILSIFKITQILHNVSQN